MPLTDAMKRSLEPADASSFRLSSDELWLVTGADLKKAADEYEKAMSQVKPDLRKRVVDEHLELATASWKWLRKHNVSLEERLAGYSAMGRAFGWEYPWPAVAVLSTLTLRTGLRRSEAMRAAGLAVRPVLEVGDWLQDVLRRSNRGMFADAIPTALWALRCHGLRQKGEGMVAEALLDGPLPPAMDEECRSVIRNLDASLRLESAQERFVALTNMTSKQLDREQAVITAALGSMRNGRNPSWEPWRLRFTRMKKVEAPVVRGGKVVFEDFALPKEFEVRSHGERLAVFEKAYLKPLTGSIADFKVAAAEVARRFPPKGPPEFKDGPLKIPSWNAIAVAEV
jgi:hypothetical protein